MDGEFESQPTLITRFKLILNADLDLKNCTSCCAIYNFGWVLLGNSLDQEQNSSVCMPTDKYVHFFFVEMCEIFARNFWYFVDMCNHKITNLSQLERHNLVSTNGIGRNTRLKQTSLKDSVLNFGNKHSV